jgi:tetratricopeptide (TPR) repeat protein
MGEAAPSTAGVIDARDGFHQATDLLRRGESAAALDLFKAVLDGAHGPLTRSLARRLLKRLLNAAGYEGWAEKERLARRAVELLPDEAFFHVHLGEALLRQGRGGEAEASLQAAIALEPENGDARLLLDLARRGLGEGLASPRPRPWPQRQHAFDNLRGAIERYVLAGYPGQPIVRPQTVFTTLGSCFAQNLAQRLAEAGYRVNNEPIGEEVNSTYANRFLLEWLEHGPVSGPARAIDLVYGPARRERMLEALSHTDVLVLTLGVAACFFDIGTGAFAFSALGSATGQAYLDRHCRMRTTTVSENVDNILAILGAAERLAARPLKVVLTVSPVPLAGTTELHSAVVADCLSKSTLRLACHEAGQLRPDLIYWPSFEIVRWLGAHFSTPDAPAFGAEDRCTRHVSNWLVDLIVELFIAHNSPRLSPAA